MLQLPRERPYQPEEHCRCPGRPPLRRRSARSRAGGLRSCVKLAPPRPCHSEQRCDRAPPRFHAHDVAGSSVPVLADAVLIRDRRLHGQRPDHGIGLGDVPGGTTARIGSADRFDPGVISSARGQFLICSRYAALARGRSSRMGSDSGAPSSGRTTEGGRALVYGEAARQL